MSERCTAKIRPFPDLVTELQCEHKAGRHSMHDSVLRDYAYPGSETKISWNESDRRNYHGEWTRCPELQGRCILPISHRGDHAS